MHTSNWDTLTDLHDGLTIGLVQSPAKRLDLITSVDVQRHNIMARAESMEWEFDLKSMWLTPSRWSMMVRQYIDADRFEEWLEKCLKVGTKKRGVCVMRTKDVAARGGAATGHTNKETRRWGACMLALGYKALPEPQITLYSRTTYLGYIGALDLTVAWMAARYLAAEIGLEVDDLAFVWHVEAIQWHNFKSLAYLLNHPDKKEQKHYRKVLISPDFNVVDLSPALRLSRNWMQKVVAEDEAEKSYGDMNYNTYRRIRRRYHTEVHGFEYAQQFEGENKKGEYFKAYKPLPHCTADTLDFGPIGFGPPPED